MARTASRTTPNLGSQPLRGADFERAHSSVVLGEDVRDRRRGFTIVELLIVVVAIAILAAITIVAYNGITNRSKAAAASAAAEQAAKKVLTYAAMYSDQYPAALSDAGVSDGSTTYQYRVDNGTSPKTFCLTATTQNTSYFASSTAATPAAGACAGHGVNGGGTITNLATNPSGEVSPAFQITGSGAGGSVVSDSTRADSGNFSSKFTWGTSGSRGMMTPLMAVSPNTTYRVSLAVYVEFGPIPQWFVVDSSYGAGAIMSSVPGIGAWHRIATTYTTGPSQTSLRAYTTTSSAGAFNADSIMLTAGGSTTTNYNDGDASGWVWNGTRHNSTSTGTAL